MCGVPPHSGEGLLQTHADAADATVFLSMAVRSDAVSAASANYPTEWEEGHARDSCALRGYHCCNATISVFS